MKNEPDNFTLATIEAHKQRGEQEWTPEYVKQLIHEQPAFKDVYTRISDAHNAALAARKMRFGYHELEKQLAAEREKHEAEIRQLTTDNWRYCEEQRQQLAAERQKYDRSQERVRKWFDLLAAERENPHNWTEDREPWRNSGNIVMFHDSQAIALAATENDAKLIKTAHNAALAAVDENWTRASEMAERLTEQLVEANEQLAAEREWKREAIAVMPDYQEIGKELGLQLGESVNDNILPAIRKLKPLVEALELARVNVSSLCVSDFKFRWLDSIDDALAKVKK